MDVAGQTNKRTSKSKAQDNANEPIRGTSWFFEALGRKKPLDGRTETSLNRCLNLLDLTTLGVGSTLGLGLYVLAGQVASTKAGPAVVVSFALAALASAFSALCYAEFAGRVPRAGSAYAYSYITVGEFAAFIIGWNLILEYMIGASSVARGFSEYLRFVFEHVNWAPGSEQQATSLQQLVEQAAPQLAARGAAANNNSYQQLANETLAAAAAATLPEAIYLYVVRYFDWPSVAIIVVLTAFILFGVKESTNVTLAFTAVNLFVVVVVVCTSFKLLDLHNWRLEKWEVPAGFGDGGFAPYGWSGILAGSATCFFGFIGFDTIASSAEEAKSPRKNVPLAIILSLFVSFLAYMSIAVVQTLMWPYYDQNKVTILPYIFGRLEMPVAYWVVLLGAIAGLASSQLGGMYPLPRILYSMARDRLIYGSLGHVHKRLKLPVRATLIGSAFIALLACLLDIQDLADMVSIGTLAAYSVVSLSVLIVRYENRRDSLEDEDEQEELFEDVSLAPTCAGKQVAAQNNRHRRGEFVELKSATRLNDAQKLAVTPNGNGKPNTLFQNGLIASDELPSGQNNKLADLLLGWRRRTSNYSTQNDHLPKEPDDVTCKQSKMLISHTVILCVLIDLVALLLTSPHAQDYLARNCALTLESLRILLTVVGIILLVCLCVCTLLLSRLPTSKPPKAELFQVPLVPLTPTLSILVNTFLMLNLSALTWIRFVVWMLVGFFIYFTYGIRHSKGHLLHLTDQF